MGSSNQQPAVDYATRYVAFMKRLRGRDYEVRVPGIAAPSTPSVGRLYARSPVKSPASTPAVTPTDPPPPSPTSYSGWTKKQLYERAKDLEIPGRSKLTKAELIERLEAHDRKRAATAPAPKSSEKTSPSWLGEPLVKRTA